MIKIPQKILATFVYLRKECRNLLILALFLLFISCNNQSTATAHPLIKELDELKIISKSLKSSHFSPITLKDQNELQAAFSGFLANRSNTESFKNLGWKIDRIEKEPSCYILYPSASKFSGQGIFLVKESDSSSFMLMAPHRYYDGSTGTIAQRAFFNSSAQILALNSIHRYPKDSTGIYNKESHSQDLARQEFSAFNAIAHAYIERNGNSPIIQIHGYNAKSRVSPQGRSSNVILSSENRLTISPEHSSLKTKMNGIPEFSPTLLYGIDIFELGATQNPTGKFLRAMGSKQFFHIELEKKVRRALIEDDALLKKWISILEANQR